jgi:N-methylhydantoinase A
MPLEKQEENASEMGTAIHIGVDIGGTFTDLAAYDAGTGRIRYAKSLATHACPLDDIMACVDKVGIDLGEAALFRHGATLLINTLLAE